MNWTEQNIEKFIIENKDKFDRSDPSTYHDNHFLNKLHAKFKKLISIVPYLVKTGIAYVIIFIISVWVWNSYIRKDRHDVTLKQKIENIIHFKN